MRGLQIVQTDLYERFRADPRYWTMCALLLPVVGAGGYLLYRYVELKSADAKKAISAKRSVGPAGEPGAVAPEASGTGLAFPFRMAQKFDPAVHVAKKRTTRKGLSFLDVERQSVVVAKDGELISGLDRASEMLEEALLELARGDIHIEHLRAISIGCDSVSTGSCTSGCRTT